MRALGSLIAFGWAVRAKGKDAMIFQQMLQFIQDPQNEFLGRTNETLLLCVIPTLAALVIAVPLGILVAQRPLAAFVAITMGGLARAIPVLVFLVAVYPYLGFGFRPAAIALTLLGIGPILLNTIEGLRGIDPAAIEAARGMGMTRRQILGRIQIPLVLPVLAAGIRTAAVQIVATSPLAIIIAAGGYGAYIEAGLSNLADPTELLVGSVSVAVLALLTEVGLAALQRALTPAGVRGAALGESTPESVAPRDSEPQAA